jgi:tRNA nucleotidyltransferase/poly(A) polymerase
MRFERRFGFAIGRHTQNLIRNAVRLDLIERLPKPRLFSELELILKEEEPIGILKRLASFGIGPTFHPKITLDKAQIVLLEETSEILVWFSLLFLEEKVERWAVLFLSLLNPLSPEEAKKFAADLGVGRWLREWVRYAKDDATDITHRLLSARVVSRKFVYDCLNPLPNEVILYLMAKAKSNDIKRKATISKDIFPYISRSSSTSGRLSRGRTSRHSDTRPAPSTRRSWTRFSKGSSWGSCARRRTRSRSSFRTSRNRNLCASPLRSHRPLAPSI